MSRPNHDEHILRILGEAPEPLFPSEITDALNRELGTGPAYTTTDIVMHLKRFGDKVAQLPDGRWILKKRMTL